MYKQIHSVIVSENLPYLVIEVNHCMKSTLKKHTISMVFTLFAVLINQVAINFCKVKPKLENQRIATKYYQ